MSGKLQGGLVLALALVIFLYTLPCNLSHVSSAKLRIHCVVIGLIEGYPL